MAPVIGSGRPLSMLFERCIYDREVESIAQLAFDANLNGEEVVKKVISRVYEVDDVDTLLADVAADNTEETQVGIKPLDTFMVAVLHSGSYKAKVKPVPHTDISTGVVFPHPFYLKHKTVVDAEGEEQKVRYSAIVVYLLNMLHQQNAPQLSNCFLQVLEATFNCVARHKEVFEYMIGVYISLKREGSQISKTSPSSPRSLETMFNIWLDTYKRQALFASIINPLLFLHQNCYAVYENLASHGASFWAAAIQSIFNIPMPFELIPDLDRGWSWGALVLNESNPLVQQCVSLCMASPNTHWKAATAELKAPPSGSSTYRISQEYVFSMRARRRYTSLSCVLSALQHGTLDDEELREYAAPLQRFLFLCSPGKVQEAFLQHVMNCGDKFPGLESFSIPSMFDIDDCGNIAAAPTQEFLAHVRSVGVDLETCKHVSIFTTPSGSRRSSVCTSTSDSSATSKPANRKKRLSSMLSSFFNRMICNGKTAEDSDG
eukprot:TRINITY_DN21724_c0_g1_i1.p1 TRINITY_DN21724_c0_g1~~TRINITY_DN21724_c0_g1_i1.p1  ORF type:complete len:514 (+),score=75.31 TRINITY_DN21724_c0_g1_i1:78-1544(+)